MKADLAEARSSRSGGGCCGGGMMSPFSFGMGAGMGGMGGNGYIPTGGGMLGGGGGGFKMDRAGGTGRTGSLLVMPKQHTSVSAKVDSCEMDLLVSS